MAQIDVGLENFCGENVCRLIEILRLIQATGDLIAFRAYRTRLTACATFAIDDLTATY